MRALHFSRRAVPCLVGLDVRASDGADVHHAASRPTRLFSLSDDATMNVGACGARCSVLRGALDRVMSLTAAHPPPPPGRAVTRDLVARMTRGAKRSANGRSTTRAAARRGSGGGSSGRHVDAVGPRGDTRGTDDAGEGARLMLLERVRIETEVKRSRFVAVAAPVSSAAEAMAFVSEAGDASASHNCFAYKVRLGGGDHRRRTDVA